MLGVKKVVRIAGIVMNAKIMNVASLVAALILKNTMDIFNNAPMEFLVGTELGKDLFCL